MTEVQPTPPTLSDPDDVTEAIERFIQRTVSAADADGVVVNLSGGIDSTVSATLAAGALGSDRVTGLILPTDANQERNIDDAIHVAEELVIDHRVIEMQDLLDAFTRTVSTVTRDVHSDPMQGSKATITVPVGHREHFTSAVGNAAARMRMMMAYFEANTTDRLVLGTGNRTELLLGYFTKYGDGAADLLPIGSLYKSEVRQVAKSLNIRREIITKEPTAGLWAGQADEVELGASYDQIDTVLWNLEETEADMDTIADGMDVDLAFVQRFERMVEASAHKRQLPAQPIDDGTQFERD